MTELIRPVTKRLYEDLPVERIMAAMKAEGATDVAWEGSAGSDEEGTFTAIITSQELQVEVNVKVSRHE